MNDKLTSPKCPECHCAFNGFLQQSWGDGIQKLPFAPFICTSCAALSVIDLATGEIEAVPSTFWDIVRDRNPLLWKEIEQARMAVLDQLIAGALNREGGSTCQVN